MGKESWVRTWLSAPRWNTYLQASSDDPQLALALYEWNIELAAAVMHDVAHIEVAVRNIYDRTISDGWQGSDHWLLDSSSPVTAPLIRMRCGRTVDLNARNRASITDAVRRVHKPHPLPGQVIAELPFGFWRHLTDAAHEKTLWVPLLNQAFPKRTSRKDVERSLALINTVRNRASHHEPLFTRARCEQLRDAHDALLRLAHMLLPPLATHIAQTSTVASTLRMHPH